MNNLPNFQFLIANCCILLIILFTIIANIGIYSINRTSKNNNNFIDTDFIVEEKIGGNNKKIKNLMNEFSEVSGDVFLILPCQLFEETPAKKFKQCYIIEDPIYFTRLKFHKLKLIFHRATMKFYFDYLKSLGCDIQYIEYENVPQFYKKINQEIKNGKNIKMFDPIDKLLNLPKNIKFLSTPYFLNTKDDLAEYKNQIKSYRHDQSFYPMMRKKLDVLISKGKPIGGKWTYDNENRNAFEENQEEVKIWTPHNNKYIKEAKQYIEQNFANNPGSTEYFIYPSNHDEAKLHLDEFIKNRLKLFGKYQDAVKSDIAFGFHSVLSSSINSGLLTPQYVLHKIINADAPLNSKEGFIRQLIGWREYCQLIYIYEGDKMQTSNYFNSKRKLNEKWWTGETGLKPIDDIIKRIQKYSYAHHIERLMYLSAVMLMCNIDPIEVYNWFISFISIDAYDWVMVPNIYGMGTYADGGIMMTRPYFSSGSYIKKMSNYETSETIELWTTLYYNFIANNSEKLRKNYYTARWIGNYEKKSEKEKKEIKKMAEKFISNVTQ